MPRRNSSSNVNRTTARRSASKSELKPGADVEANAGKAEQLPVVRQQNIDESANNGPGNWVQGLLGAMSDAVRPIASLAAKPTRRTKRTHSIATPVLAASGLESLEKRTLLTFANQLTIGIGETVILDNTNINMDRRSDLYSMYVTNVANGQFEYTTIPGTAVLTFSQQWIDGGFVQFVHDGSENAPTWDLYIDPQMPFEGDIGPLRPTIHFIGADAAPVITSDGGESTASISVAENSEEVTTVEVNDDNLPDDTLTFSISGGDDAEMFSIDAETGVLTFVEDAGFEAPGDTDSDNVYSVHVTVTDSADLTDEQELEITVTDANESADVKLTPSDMPVLDKQDTTDGVIVGSFSVADPDDDDGDDSETGSAEHVVSLIGDDADFFSLDGTDIVFAAGVLDAATKPFYSATLRVEDGANTVDTEVRVNVLTLQQQIDRLEDGDTLTLIPGTYAGFTITDKVLDIVADGVTIQGVLPALTIDNSTVTITGMVILDSEDAEVPQPEIVIKNAGSLTLVDTTVRAESDRTLALISVEDTSTLDLSSGDNALEATDSGAAFVSAAEDSEVIWDDENTLSVVANEDEELEIDVRLDGSEVVNLFTNPETKGFVIVNDDGTLTFTPEDDFSGTAWFDFELSSGLTGTVEVGVRSVNDQPSFVTGDDVTVDADVIGEQTIEGHIDMSLVDLGSDDENDDQSPSFTTTVDSELFSSAPSIDSDGNLTFELDEEAVRSLKLGEEVVTTVSVTLHDDGGTENGGIDTSETLTFTITIVGTNDAPVADEETNSGDEDDTITGTLSASDVDHDSSFTFSLVDPVPGLTINSDGTYSLDASDEAYQSLKQGETFDVVAEYLVTDEHGASSTGSLTITLTGVNDAPVAVDDVDSGSEDDTITGMITPGDVDHDAMLTYELTEDVEGLTLNEDGSYSLDTSSDTYQSLKPGETLDVVAEYTVRDEHESSSTGTLTITLTGSNDAPVITIDDELVLTTMEDTLTALPINGISVSDVDESDSGLSVTLSVRNGLLSVDAALASAANVTFTGSGTRSVIVSGTATDLNRFLAATGGGPRGRSVNRSAGITYSPDADYNSVDGAVNPQGAEWISVVATDNAMAASAPETTTIAVTEVNDAPVAVTGMRTVNEDGTVTFSIQDLASPGPSIESPNQSFTLVGGGRIVAAHGFVTLNIAAGTVTYKPTSNYFGLDTFSFQVRDNGTTNGIAARLRKEITVHMTVRPVNDAPTFTIPESIPSVQDNSGAQSLPFVTQASAGPSNEQSNVAYGPFAAPHNNQQTTLSYIVTNDNSDLFAVQPAIDAAGNLTYQPAAGISGSATVSVTLNDGGGTENGGVQTSVTKTFVIEVTDVNDAPHASAGTFTATEDMTLDGDLYSLVSDPETEDALLTYTQVGDPLAGLTLNSDGTFSYLNPTENFNGTVTFQYKVSDGSFETEPETVTINVNSVEDAPVVTSNGGEATASVSLAENSTEVATVTASDEDSPAQPLSYSISGGADAQSFAIDSTTGVLTFLSGKDFESPNDSDSNNVYVVEIQVSDGLLTDTQLISVTVTDVYEAPTILGPAANTTSMRPTLSWKSETTAVSYEITVSELLEGTPASKLVVVNNGSGNISLSNYSVTGTSYTPPSDLGIGRFNYRIRSVNANGDKSAWSSPRTFNVTTAAVINPLSNVRQLVARPTITWQSLPGAVKYDVWVGDISDLAAADPLIIRTESTSTSWSHSSDLSIGRYRIWVRGVDESGAFRSWSAPIEFVVAPAPVVTPLLSTFDRTPTFTWTAVAGAQNYEIVVKSTANGAEAFRQTVTGTSATPTTDLSLGSYSWQVRATGVAQYSSNFSTSSTTFVGGRPVVNPAVVNNGIPTFSWQAVQGAATYQIQVNRVDVAQANVINVSGLAAPATSYTPTTPLTAGTYRFWIKAFSANPADGSFWSLASEFTVAANETASSGNSGVEESLVTQVTSQLREIAMIAQQQHQPASEVVSDTNVITVDAPNAFSVAMPMPSKSIAQTALSENTQNASDTPLMDSSLIDTAVSNIITDGLLDQVFDGRKSV